MNCMEPERSTRPTQFSELSPRLAAMKSRIRAREHHSLRTTQTIDLLGECDAENLSWARRAARRTRRMCEAQTVVIGADERIVFTRTVREIPPIYSDAQRQSLTAGRTLHELGPISNICADWDLVLSQGLLGRRQEALKSLEQARRNEPHGDAQRDVEFLECAIETIDAVLALTKRYADQARTLGRDEIASILERVPAGPAETFHEALQSLRLCHAVLWLSGHYHCGLGRFDQYLWPRLKADLESGRLTDPQAEELLAEFFISLNKDSDLYPGIQQGDNGQSLMLGGVRPDGTPGINPLTSMVLRVARAVALIDPKINLRVDRNTSPDLLAQAVELTRIGLGFPQYANDEVVIPGLVAAGYDLEDARNYSVAACWEFLIPGRGMEVVNIGAVSMPSAVDKAIQAALAAGEDMPSILKRVNEDIGCQVRALAEASRKLLLPPAPYYSVLMDGCLEAGRDLSHGLKYNNFGIHGAASSNAADALAAVEHLVFDQKTITPERLLRGLKTNFADDTPLLQELREHGPKAGNHDDRADRFLTALFRMFSDQCAAAGTNGRGGHYRPGSGSAMYYVWLAQGHSGMREPSVGATADGRRAGEYFSSSLAPSPGVTVRGPLSVLQSFGKIDYSRICNGGPLTMELSDSLFRGPDAVEKVALFVQAFVRSGCQQLQLNTLNVDTLRDAQRHPELHRNLVVRVWGWSGYFCELDAAYQNQIIGRHVYGS
jgi:formate C-acetyltransferase